MRIENRIKTKIKICGLRRREDILAVNESGPDYCGFIIEFPKSFRSVTAEKVRELVKELSPEIQPVGVFVNASMELVTGLLNDGTLAAAQLHGQEDETYIRELKQLSDKPIIKAFSVKTAEDIPKGKIFDCMEALKKVTVTAPVQIGEVIIKNVCGTGVDVIATKKVNALT